MKEHHCRDCAYFINPQPSLIYANVTVTYDCPHSPHHMGGDWDKGYAVSCQKACDSFRQAQFSQMELF